MRDEFRYRSELMVIPIITLLLSFFSLVAAPEKLKVIFFLALLLSGLFIFFPDNALGSFEADETSVTFITAGKRTTIDFKDITKLTIKNEQICGGRVPTYYKIYLEIVTTDNVYEYTSKFEPKFDTVEDLAEAFAEKYNRTAFVQLYNYINERISNKADEKPII